LYQKLGLKPILENICPGRVKPGERIGPYTTLKIGGKADWFIDVDDDSEVTRLLELVRDRNLPLFVLGQGSNLLVSDKGVRGAVIHLRPSGQPIRQKSVKGNRILIEVEAGMPLAGLVQWGMKNKWQGLEFLAGIPGSLGGALAMNAGSYGHEIKDLTAYLRVISPEGKMIRKGKKQLCFDYRSLRLEPGEIIVSGGLTLSAGDVEGIKKETRRLWSQRKTSQPLGQASCGSVFKNPPTDFAARLIEKAGLKGLESHGAQISHHHANFIINKGGARAKDVLYLMNLIRARVRKQFGVLLEPEVRLWGCDLKPLDKVRQVCI
jgi:UDP-N-acetylmuramate dehydrogenase